MKKLKHLSWSAVAALTLTPALAHAQDEDYETIVTVMRACSQIEDMVARVACYDNNIAPRNAALPARLAMSARTAPDANIPSSPAPDFGGENLPREREERRRSQTDKIERQVSASSEVEPGIYLLTLDDGSQWRFIESMGLSYDPPSLRSQVRIERGALSSYRLYFGGQRAVRVRRVR